MNGYLMNPSHDFTCTLVNEKMLMKKFDLKAEKRESRRNFPNGWYLASDTSLIFENKNETERNKVILLFQLNYKFQKI